MELASASRTTNWVAQTVWVVPSGAQGSLPSPAVRAEAGAPALAPKNAVEIHHDDCPATPQIASAPCGKLAPVFADVALRVAPNNARAKRWSIDVTPEVRPLLGSMLYRLMTWITVRLSGSMIAIWSPTMT